MPSKQDVRDWQQRRVKEHKPPPDAKTIRREIGWDLIDAQRKAELPLPHDPGAPKVD